MMKKRVRNYINGRLQSFRHAFDGVYILLKEERNAQIYVFVSIVALLMGYWLKISPIEWIVVCSVIGIVFALEAINTAIENLSDFACKKEINPSIKKTKDLSAAAVLFTAIVALIAGLIIFLPKLLNLLHSI